MTKTVETMLEQFYEGPQPPKRLAERVKAFRLYYPNATPEEWESFALTFGQNCYRDGFTRGYDWNERDWKGPAIDPEQLAEMQSHDWSLAEENYDWNRMLTMGCDPRSPLANVPADQRRALIEMMMGGGIFPIGLDISPYEGPPHGNPGFHRPEENDDE